MKYRKGYKYQLAEEFEIDTPIKPPTHIVTEYIILNHSGKMTIKKGYAWDGASGPTVDSDNTMTPSLVHDAFAQLMREKQLHRSWRIPSNEFLDEMLEERGMGHSRRFIWLKALNEFGGPSTDPRNVKKVLEVV